MAHSGHDYDNEEKGPIDTNLIWGGLGAMLLAWVGAWASVIILLLALAWFGIFSGT